MLGLGTTELIMVFFVALIVLGPKKLPQIAKAIGRGIAQFRRAMDADDPPSPDDYGATGEDETEENASSYEVDDAEPTPTEGPPSPTDSGVAGDGEQGQEGPEGGVESPHEEPK